MPQMIRQPGLSPLASAIIVIVTAPLILTGVLMALGVFVGILGGLLPGALRSGLRHRSSDRFSFGCGAPGALDVPDASLGSRAV